MAAAITVAAAVTQRGVRYSVMIVKWLTIATAIASVAALTVALIRGVFETEIAESLPVPNYLYARRACAVLFGVVVWATAAAIARAAAGTQA